jgi:hypothetical protein
VFEKILIEPILPENLPTYKVFGRGIDRDEIGKLVYKGPSNGLPAGYVFEPISLQYLLSHQTLWQLAQKLFTLNNQLGVER